MRAAQASVVSRPVVSCAESVGYACVIVSQGMDRAVRMPIDVAAMLAASGALSAAIAIGNGAYTGRALACVLAALAILLWRAASRTGLALPPRLTLGVTWTGLALGAWTAYRDPHPLWVAPLRPWEPHTAEIANIVLLASYCPWLLLGKAEAPWVRHARFAGFAAAFVFAGVSLIRATEPPIDVWDMQQRGAAAFLAGGNPYRTVFVRDTAPGVTGSLPYTYPPTQLYVSLLGYLAVGDVRLTMVIAVLVAGVALRFIGIARAPAGCPSLGVDAPALCVWLAPKLFLIVENGWIDPVPFVLVALVIAARVAGRRTLEALVFGLAVSSKQTMFWLVPLAACILPLRRRQWLWAAITASASVMPFAVAAPVAFVDATVGFLRYLRARPDALTIGSWVGVGYAWGAIAFALAAAAVASVCVRAARAPRLRTPSFFGVSVALVYVVFFVFNRQAFANYYFFASGLAALAAASSWTLPPERTAPVSA